MAGARPAEQLPEYEPDEGLYESSAPTGSGRPNLRSVPTGGDEHETSPFAKSGKASAGQAAPAGAEKNGGAAHGIKGKVGALQNSSVGKVASAAHEGGVGEGAAEAGKQVAKKVARKGAQTIVSATGAGTAVVAGEEALEKVSKKLGIKKPSKGVMIGLASALALLSIPVLIIIFLVSNPFKAVEVFLKAAVSVQFQNEVADSLGVQLFKQAVVGALPGEVEIKNGHAIAAPVGPAPAPGTLRDKLSKIDWQKAQFQTTASDCGFDFKTKEVLSFNGQKRSVIDKVIDRNGHEVTSMNPIVGDCLVKKFPIMQAIERSPDARVINQKAGIHFNFGEPPNSANLKDKDSSQVQVFVRQKDLSRIGGFSPDVTDKALCTKQDVTDADIQGFFGKIAHPSSQDGQVTIAIAKAVRDLVCGRAPQDISIDYPVPSDQDLTNPDLKTQNNARDKVAETMCIFYDQLATLKNRLNVISQRYNSAMAAWATMMTLSDQQEVQPLDGAEINALFTQNEAGFNQSRSWSFTTDGTDTGFDILPEALASRAIGVTPDLSDTTIPSAKAVANVAAHRMPALCPLVRTAKPNANVTQSTIDNARQVVSQMYLDGIKPDMIANSPYLAKKNLVDVSDVIAGTIRIAANLSNTGAEDGKTFSNNAAEGGKGWYYMVSLGPLGGHYYTPPESILSQINAEQTRRAEFEHSSLLARLFNPSLNRSLAARAIAMTSDTPPHLAMRSFRLFANALRQPLELLANLTRTGSEIATGKSSVAIAANDDDRNYYKLDPAGTTKTDDREDLLQNADYIEGVKDRGSKDQQNALSQWDQCYAGVIPPSSIVLDNDPTSYQRLIDPTDPDAAKLDKDGDGLIDINSKTNKDNAGTDHSQGLYRYCQVLYQSPNYDWSTMSQGFANSVQTFKSTHSGAQPLRQNFAGEFDLAARYRTYHRNTVIVTAMDNLSTPDQDVTAFNAGSSATNGSNLTVSGTGSVKLLQVAEQYDNYLYSSGPGDGHGDIAGWVARCGNPAQHAFDPSCPLDCSGLVNVSVYIAFHVVRDNCSSSFIADHNWQQIPYKQMQPGDIVVAGVSCGPVGHVAIVEKFNPSNDQLTIFQASSSHYPPPDQINHRTITWPNRGGSEPFNSVFRWVGPGAGA